MTILTVLVMIAMVLTVVTMTTGIASMAHGGEFDRRHSLQLMFARVGIQGVALLLLVIALVFAVR